MVDPIDVAEAAHKYCLEIFIPNGVSDPHDVSGHINLCKFYSDIINERGLPFDAGTLAYGILFSGGWDGNSKWPGHSHPDKVIEFLENYVDTLQGYQ